MNEYEAEGPYALHSLNQFLHSNAWTNNLSLATASKGDRDKLKNSVWRAIT